MAFPAGIFGLHHFYLERPYWGILYLLSGGLFGVGWLVDMCRMPCLVAEANKRLTEEAAMMHEVREQIGGAYVVSGKSDIVVIPQYNQPAGEYVFIVIACFI
jgi:TM2 domain-containing membrane protein YozV